MFTKDGNIFHDIPGGFYGSKDPNGNLIQKKIEMLKHEGVLFDSGMKVQGDCVEYAIES